MSSMRRILAAVKDPGAETVPGVVKATQLARALGAELELFHAITHPVYVDMLALTGREAKEIQREQHDQCLQRLARIGARARLHTAHVSVAAEWDYPVHEAIVRRATHIGADLVVAEQHTGQHRATGLLRPADWELLRLCPVPVLLVKHARPYHAPRVLTAIDSDHANGKTAELDEEILRVGALVTAALRGTLHVVHACRSGPYQSAAYGEAREPPERLPGKAVFDQALRLWDIPPERRHLLSGEPSIVVPAIARSVGANIVVAGALSRSGLQRLLIGNTAERLLDPLSCDLLIIKPSEFVSRVPAESPGAELICAQPLG